LREKEHKSTSNNIRIPAQPLILILSENLEESESLIRICKDIGSVYSSSEVREALNLIKSIDINVLVLDHTFSLSSLIKDLLQSSTSVVLIGKERTELGKAEQEWPEGLFVNTVSLPLQEHDYPSARRIIKNAARHSLLRIEIQNLQSAVRRDKSGLKEAYNQIKELKSFINESIVKELEKRIALEAKYVWFKKEKQKIEKILKKLYIANDVTSLLDIVNDVKEITLSEGISIYILDENEIHGKYLKPLVWDDAFLTHPDFSKHVVLIDSNDFASSVASYGQEINISDLSFDKRLSKRYKEHLKTPLESILSVPIMHDKEVIGVLEVYNKKQKEDSNKKGFSREDQRLLSRLSEHISIAITKLNLIQYDALTGILRPDPFLEKVLQKLRAEKKRRQEISSYALVMGDVDWFKIYNDRNGQETGNKLLRELASVLKSSVREDDLICRYGGEEFLFFLTKIKSQEEAFRLTERIRQNIENKHFENQEFQPRNNLTMSFGITFFSANRFLSTESISKLEIKKLINEANIALAEAKGKQTSETKPGARTLGYNIKNTVRIHIDQQTPPKDIADISFMEKDRKGRERRRAPRFMTSSAIIHMINRHNLLTKTINLSLGGARVCTEIELVPETIHDLILLLGEDICQCRGNVVYTVKDRESDLYYSGLKFDELSQKDSKALEKYLSALVNRKSNLTQ
jgi:diguanylate cyclase (GGDEF)-like protein